MVAGLTQLDWTSASLQAAFEQFHRDNPLVYETLVRLATEWRGRGYQRCGIGMLWEVMRWEVSMSTTGDEFKLNNNFRSRYVRKLVGEHPEFGEMFEMRELKAI